MHGLSVPEAARLLGVSTPRVHQRITDGSLEATRVGDRWVVSSESVRRLQEPVPGRPWSTRSAWALVATSVGAAGGRGPAQEWSRAYLAARARKERIRAADRWRSLLADARGEPSEDLATQIGARLRQALGSRAGRVLLRAAPEALERLRDDVRVAPAGVSSAASRMGSRQMAELYVDAEAVERLVTDHRLQTSAEPNVVLHLVDEEAALSPPRQVLHTPLLLAADLAEHRRPAHERRALEILTGLAGARG
jgi:excisionase family DNA binding protein